MMSLLVRHLGKPPDASRCIGTEQVQRDPKLGRHHARHENWLQRILNHNTSRAARVHPHFQMTIASI